MSVVGAHENRPVAKANPHGAWDRGICMVSYILTHTQPLRLRPPVAVFCSPAVLAAPFPPHSARGETECVYLMLLGVACHPLQFGSPACLVTSVL